MNSFVFAACLALVAVANAGVLLDPSTKIIQGPSSRTTLVGPDGSVISSVAPGGQIIHEESRGVIAKTAPVVATAPIFETRHALAYAAPSALAYNTHSVFAPSVISGYSDPLLAGSPVISGYSAPVFSGW